MKVRHATEADRIAVIGLLRDSHAAAGFEFPFSAPHADMLFQSHLADGLALVIGDPAAGILLAKSGEHPFGAGKWAVETVWYISPSARGRSAVAMLKAYEAWAREHGCVGVSMVSMASNDVSALYSRLGYGPRETHFSKAL